MKFSKIKLQMIKEKNFEYNSRKILSTTDVVKYINSFEEIDKMVSETAFLICLNSKNHIVAYSEISKGGSDFCNLDFKNIFKIILLSNSTKFILIHNHPSGDPTPSRKDFEVTKRIKKASEILQVAFLDHIVIGENNSFCSCMED